jgi:hypothetical protein
VLQAVLGELEFAVGSSIKVEFLSISSSFNWWCCIMLGGNALASMLTRGHPNNLCSIFGDNADKNLTELSIVNLEWKLGEWR